MNNATLTSIASQGFSLLEVLCSLAIFAIALLGLLGMQLTSIRYAYSSLLHAQAQIQLVNLVEQCTVSKQINEKQWKNANAMYFPNPESVISGTNASLAFQAYGQPEQLSLSLNC